MGLQLAARRKLLSMHNILAQGSPTHINQRLTPTHTSTSASHSHTSTSISQPCMQNTFCGEHYLCRCMRKRPFGRKTLFQKSRKRQNGRPKKESTGICCVPLLFTAAIFVALHFLREKIFHPKGRFLMQRLISHFFHFI